jgi:hypothetical protein
VYMYMYTVFIHKLYIYGICHCFWVPGTLSFGGGIFGRSCITCLLFMFVCLNVCKVFIFVYIYIYMFMYVFIYMFMYVFIYIYIYRLPGALGLSRWIFRRECITRLLFMFLCLNVCKVFVFVYICIYVHVCIYTYVHVCIYIYIYRLPGALGLSRWIFRRGCITRLLFMFLCLNVCINMYVHICINIYTYVTIYV